MIISVKPHKDIFLNLTPISLERKEKYNSFGIKAINKIFKNAVMSGQLNAVRYFLLVEKVNIHLYIVDTNCCN